MILNQTGKDPGAGQRTRQVYLPMILPQSIRKGKCEKLLMSRQHRLRAPTTSSPNRTSKRIPQTQTTRQILIKSIPSLSYQEVLRRETIHYGISRRMDVPRAENQQGSQRALECGETPRSNVEAVRRSRPASGQMHTRPLEPEHRRSVLLETERLTDPREDGRLRLSGWGFVLAPCRVAEAQLRGGNCSPVSSDQGTDQ